VLVDGSRKIPVEYRFIHTKFRHGSLDLVQISSGKVFSPEVYRLSKKGEPFAVALL
jgi:hypothetical protein